MPLKLGNITVESLYVGGQKVSLAYLGSTLVYQADGGGGDKSALVISGTEYGADGTYHYDSANGWYATQDGTFRLRYSAPDSAWEIRNTAIDALLYSKVSMTEDLPGIIGTTEWLDEYSLENVSLTVAYASPSSLDEQTKRHIALVYGDYPLYGKQPKTQSNARNQALIQENPQ